MSPELQWGHGRKAVERRPTTCCPIPGGACCNGATAASRGERLGDRLSNWSSLLRGDPGRSDAHPRTPLPYRLIANVKVRSGPLAVRTG